VKIRKKIVATRCQILRLNSAKFAYIPQDSIPQTSLGELTALPRPLALFKGPTSKGREGKERKGKGDGKERRGKER